MGFVIKPRMDYGSRQKKFQQAFDTQGLAGFVVTHPANLRYLCGYTGSNGLLLFLGNRSGSGTARTRGSSLTGRRIFFTDGRYTEQARHEVGGARVVISKGPLLPDTVKLIGLQTSATIGFESDHTTVASAGLMRKLVSRRNSLEAGGRPHHAAAHG